MDAWWRSATGEAWTSTLGWSSEGWALAYRRYSRDYVDEERQARQAGAGVSRGDFTAPWEWRAQQCSRRQGIADRDCSDFASWGQAQRFYRAQQPGDPHRLDGDGEACEGLR